MSREHERFLKVLFDSSAVQKFEDNRKHELSFADATPFWGITENMKGDQLDERLEDMDKTLAELDRILADVDAETTGGRMCRRRHPRHDQHPPLHGGPLRAPSRLLACAAGDVPFHRLRLTRSQRIADTQSASRAL